MSIFKRIIEKFKKDDFNIISFHKSIHQDDEDKFYWYLKNYINKQNINQVDLSGNTALHYAIRNKNIDFITALTNSGAKVNITDNKGDSPLLSVCKSAAYLHIKYMEIIPLILSSINTKNFSNEKYKRIFNERNINIKKDINTVKILIKNKANTNEEDKDKNTSLFFAIQAENLDIVILLIQNGANLLNQNNDGKTALSIALDGKNHEILNAIFSKIKNLRETELFIHETKKTVK